MTSLLLFIQFIIVSLDGLTTGVFYELILEGKNRNRSWKIIRPMVFWSEIFLVCLPSYLMQKPFAQIVYLLITFAMNIVTMHAFYCVNWRKTFFMYYAFYGCTLACELVVVFFPMTVEQMNWTVVPTIKEHVVCFLLSTAAKLAYAFYVRKKDPQIKKISTCLLPMLPLLMVGVEIAVHEYISGSADPSNYYFFGYIPVIVIVALAGATFYLWLHHDRRKLSAYEKDCQLQMDYYQSLMESTREQEKLRHDTKNILLTIQSLMQEKRKEEAARLLQDVKIRLKEAESPVLSSCKEAA